MKKFIKRIRIYFLERKILNYEISADSYKRWAKSYAKSTCGCGHSAFSSDGTCERNNEAYCRKMVEFFKQKLKNLK